MAKELSKKPADDETIQQTQEHLTPANVKDTPYSFLGYFDSFAKVFAGIAFVCWMIQEWVIPSDRIFLFIAILFGLADVFYLVLHKILTRSRLVIVFGWVVFSVIIIVIAKHSAETKPSTAPTAIAVPQPDYIEGTEFTRKQIDDFFPYGYAIIYLNDERQKEIHEVHNKLLDWKIDWDKVSIQPDFQNGMVTFVVPNVSAIRNADPLVILDGNLCVSKMPLKDGLCRHIGIIMMFGVPVPNVFVLSANQRKPVFGIGYRIPRTSEGRPPNPPYFPIQP